MLFAHLIYLACLNRGILVIKVIELNLHHLDFGMVGEYAVKQHGLVVKGYAEVADKSFLFECEGGFIRLALIVARVVVMVLRVHKVKIEIINTALLELKLKQRAYIRLCFEKAVGQFIREQVGRAVISFCKAFADGNFRFAAYVAVSRVKIIESSRNESVNHSVEFYYGSVGVLCDQALCGPVFPSFFYFLLGHSQNHGQAAVVRFLFILRIKQRQQKELNVLPRSIRKEFVNKDVLHPCHIQELVVTLRNFKLYL